MRTISTFIVVLCGPVTDCVGWSPHVASKTRIRRQSSINSRNTSPDDNDGDRIDKNTNVSSGPGRSNAKTTNMSLLKKLEQQQDASIEDLKKKFLDDEPLTSSSPLPIPISSEAKTLSPIAALQQGSPLDNLSSAVNLGLIGIATTGLVSSYNNLLIDYEWMQTWRYTWPLVGLFFVYEVYTSFAQDFNLLPSASSSSSSSIEMNIKGNNNINQGNIEIENFNAMEDLARETISLQCDRPIWFRLLAMIAGASLVIGGAADAFLPVYVTGPNLITTAGLAPDAAAFLACFQAIVLIQRVWNSSMYGNRKENNINLTLCGAHVLLLSQLLILGLGTFDECVTVIVENVNTL